MRRKGNASGRVRLTGDVAEHLCVRHLSGRLRVVVAFRMPELTAVVLIGPHDDTDPGIDVHTQLYALAHLRAPLPGAADQAVLLRRARATTARR